MAVIVVKHRTVATLTRAAGKNIQLDVWDDDGKPLDTLHLLRDVWEEMGSPRTVTISVEPGDLLNP